MVRFFDNFVLAGTVISSILATTTCAAASNLPAVDLAGHEGIASGGVFFFDTTAFTTTAFDVGVASGLSVGVAAQSWPTLFSRTREQNVFLAARLTGQVARMPSGVMLGYSIALVNRLASAVYPGQAAGGQIIPAFVGAISLPDWEGMPVTARFLVGVAVPWAAFRSDPSANGDLPTPPDWHVVPNAEIAIGLAPGWEAVVGGGSLIGLRTYR